MSDGDLSKELDDRFGSQCGDILVFFDALDNCNSESVNVKIYRRNSLTWIWSTEEGFLESPTPTGFKVTVSNSNPNIVMVGFRVHVGNTLANHIPSKITIFQRVIKLDEGMKSWYDIPFTVAESLLPDEEITISIGTTFNRSTLPRIDTLEIYGSGKKRCIGQVTPIEEQAWPVRTPRPVAFQLVADTPLLTGQQTIFLFFPDMIKGMFLAVVIGPPVVVAIILIVQESILNILETLKEEGNRVLFNALAVFALREINLSQVTFSTTTFYLSRNV
ncbi:unnamed protein product [Lactuca saligna]|uniref:Uncharacterized protein n=1 Tax=Lactuca saligna TaxID=75948 RepID=A0AA35V3U9_LACSI|nr:unnamed protein product [Lactuca saligna]